MSNSQTLNKNIQLNHITGGTYMQEVTLSLKEYNNLLKDSRDLMLISLENKHLKRQLSTANEHIDDLNDNVNLYISLYQSADARADRVTNDWRSISMSNTYNLNQAYLEVLNKLDEGYSFEDLKDTLDSIEEELNIKVDNTIGLKRSVDLDVETIDKEIKRLQTIKNKK